MVSITMCDIYCLEDLSGCQASGKNWDFFWVGLGTIRGSLNLGKKSLSTHLRQSGIKTSWLVIWIVLHHLPALLLVWRSALTTGVELSGVGS